MYRILADNEKLQFNSLMDLNYLTVNRAANTVNLGFNNSRGYALPPERRQVCISLDRLEKEYPNIRQALRVLQHAGIHKHNILSRLQRWIPEMERNSGKRMLFLESSQTPIMFYNWVTTTTLPLLYQGSENPYQIRIREASGRTWRIAFSELDANFPGFSTHFKTCWALGIPDSELTHTVKEMVTQDVVAAPPLPDDVASLSQ